jgi:hypothetical protein
MRTKKSIGMEERLSKDRIIERYRRKMIGVLEGSIETEQVCGLSIESLREDLLAERDRLLKECACGESIDHSERPTPDSI